MTKMVPLVIFGVLLGYVLISFLEYFVHGHVMHSPLDPSHLNHHMAVNLDMTLEDEKGTYFEKGFALAILTMSFVLFLGVIRFTMMLSRVLSPYFQYVLAAASVFLATYALKAFISFERTGEYESKQPIEQYEMVGLIASCGLFLYAPLAS